MARSAVRFAKCHCRCARGTSSTRPGPTQAVVIEDKDPAAAWLVDIAAYQWRCLVNLSKGGAWVESRLARAQAAAQIARSFCPGDGLAPQRDLWRSVGGWPAPALPHAEGQVLDCGWPPVREVGPLLHAQNLELGGLSVSARATARRPRLTHRAALAAARRGHRLPCGSAAGALRLAERGACERCGRKKGSSLAGINMDSSAM